MRVLLRVSLGLGALALIGVCAYELRAIRRARAATDRLLVVAREAAGPPLSGTLPPEWIEALLRVEDPAFRTHRGVDLRTPGQGLTTITQALVKRIYFERFTPGFAKIEQSLIARYVLDGAVSKDEQLDLFLGLAYFGSREGRDVDGFGEAARVYFGRPLPALERREFLSLVAMLPAPNALAPGSAANDDRVARIERLLEGRCAPAGLRDVWLEGCAR